MDKTIVVDLQTSIGITMPAEIRKAINDSLWDGAPVLVSYRSDAGRVETTYRGSTHAHSASEVAIWVRNKNGGLRSAAERGQRLTLVYRNPRRPAFVNLQGRARLVTDEETNRRIYDESPPREQASDMERKGIGIIVAVERLAGSFDGKPLHLGA